MTWSSLTSIKKGNIQKDNHIAYVRRLSLTIVLFFISFIFPTVANADDAMPNVISTAITDMFNGIKGVFIVQNITFSALPRVSITANPCITASGCMSSDNPKYDCRANRWVISMSGGMPPVKIPSPYSGAKAILIQVEELTNIIRKNLPDTPRVEIGTYDPQKEWPNNNLINNTISVKIGETLEMSVDLSKNIIEGIKRAIGKSSSYIDADGEVCGPGIDETTGNRIQSLLLDTQNLINSTVDTLRAKIVWQLPEKTSIQNLQRGINDLNIIVGGNKIPVPMPAPVQPLFYQQNQANLQSLSELHLKQSNSNDPKAILAAAKDFYGYAIAAQQGVEQANQYIEKRKKEKTTSSPQSFLTMPKLVFNRLMHFAKATEEEMRLSQVINDLQNSLKISFVEVDAFSAIRHLAIYNLPILVVFADNNSDPKTIHSSVILDYNLLRDMFVIFSGRVGLAKISWDTLMSSQPRFLVGILNEK